MKSIVARAEFKLTTSIISAVELGLIAGTAMSVPVILLNSVPLTSTRELFILLGYVFGFYAVIGTIAHGLATLVYRMWLTKAFPNANHAWIHIAGLILMGGGAYAMSLAVNFHAIFYQFGELPLLKFAVISCLLGVLAQFVRFFRKGAFGRHLITAVTLALLCFGVYLAAASTGEPSRVPAKAATPPNPGLRAGNGYRVMVIGIDSATWDVMDPLLEAGKMPVFQSLIDRGIRSPLRTILPTLSPIVWNCIGTGKCPAKHGVFDFATHEMPGLPNAQLLLPEGTGLRKAFTVAEKLGLVSMRPVSDLFRKCGTVWEIASDCGITCGVVSWFGTLPWRPINGFLVSDYLYFQRMANKKGDEILTYPAELSAKVKTLEKEILERHHDEINLPMPIDEGLRELTESGVAEDRFYIELGKKLYSEMSPQLFCTYVRNLDKVEHLFWQYRREGPLLGDGDAINQYYQFMDELLGRLIEGIDSNTVVIVLSDHGHHKANFWQRYRTGHSGSHEDAPDGILLMAGGPVKAHGALRDPHVFDIAPTVLTLLGLPTARDMDGRVLEEAFAAPLESKQIDSYGMGVVPDASGGKSSVDKEVVDRFRALGYFN